MATPAHATPGRCAEGTGVTVVVDYGSLGGGTQVGCAPDGGGQAGAQVVAAAGFPMTFVSGEPFVCRIAGRPAADAEDCSGTPPADAYWGLFWSDGDPASWTYSTLGITGLEVPEGGSIGWRWQDGGGRDLPGASPTPPAPADDPSDGASNGSGGGGSGGQGGSGSGGQGGSQGGSGSGGQTGGGAGATAPTPTPSGASAPASAAAGEPAGAPASRPPSTPSSRADGGASPTTPRSSEPAAARPRPRRTTDGASGRAKASTDAGGARTTAEEGSATRALEPTSGEPVGDTTDAGSAVTLWLAAAVLLALGAGALVLGRWRRTGT